MADYILYYFQTLLTPLLILLVSLCLLRFCCKHCRKHSDTDSELDLTNSDHIYVIPNPIHIREETEERDERDEIVTYGNPEFTPPPYELVCPPPSYAEASFKLDISDVQVTANSEMENSYVSPPPYSPPLDITQE